MDDYQHMAQAYQMAVMPYEGIYVGFPLILNPSSLIPPPWGNYTALNQIELTVSRDLRSWERVADREVFIGVEPWNGTNYATTQVGMAGRPIVRGDEIWIYHGANRFRGPMEVYPEEYQRYGGDVGAMYLTKLRLDGFVSLDARGDGTVVSRPFDLGGGELRVNADASGGELRCRAVGRRDDGAAAGSERVRVSAAGRRPYRRPAVVGRGPAASTGAAGAGAVPAAGRQPLRVLDRRGRRGIASGAGSRHTNLGSGPAP